MIYEMDLTDHGYNNIVSFQASNILRENFKLKVEINLTQDFSNFSG